MDYYYDAEFNANGQFIRELHEDRKAILNLRETLTRTSNTEGSEPQHIAVWQQHKAMLVQKVIALCEEHERIRAAVRKATIGLMYVVYE